VLLLNEIYMLMISLYAARKRRDFKASGTYFITRIIFANVPIPPSRFFRLVHCPHIETRVAACTETTSTKPYGVHIEGSVFGRRNPTS
jgi:hypothetical protein